MIPVLIEREVVIGHVREDVRGSVLIELDPSLDFYISRYFACLRNALAVSFAQSNSDCGSFELFENSRPITDLNSESNFETCLKRSFLYY